MGNDNPPSFGVICSEYLSNVVSGSAHVIRIEVVVVEFNLISVTFAGAARECTWLD